MIRRRLAYLLLVLLPACGDSGPEIRIYTSIYPHVIDEIEGILVERFPDVTFTWYQKGSEQIAVRLNTELEAGGTECDLLLTSDPFYYAQLRDAGHLLAYETAATKDVPDDLKDPAHHFATVRIPLMVIGIRPGRGQFVRSFAKFREERFDGMLTMGDPLKSGTTFTAVAALTVMYDWSFFEDLRRRDILSAGGNSAVFRRLDSGERDVGMILLENLLAAQPESDLGDPSPVRVVYPEDGAIPIPSPAAILRHTQEPEIAKAVFDALFSSEVQRAIVRGHMYSPLPGHKPPNGARPLDSIKVFPWSNEFLEDVRKRRDEIKKRWRKVMR